MKKMKKNLLLTALTGICLILFSFAPKWGGEGFEIYLNNKLVVQQFGKDMDNTRSLQLDANYSNTHLSVKYYHCGKMGTNRRITVRDQQNNLLKEWQYSNSSDATMNCPVNEIMGLQKEKNKSLNLFYSSSELTKERLLVTITKTN